MFRLLLIIIALLCIGCRSSEPVKTVTSDMETALPDQELWNSRVIFTQNERISTILQAKYLAVYESAGLTIADSSFTLDMFDSEGRHTTLITADSGVVKGEDTLMALGNVVVVSDSGMILRTERLIWDRLRKLIVSDTDVVMTSETDTLYGKGLESDEKINNWEIFNPRGTTVRELAKEKSETKSPAPAEQDEGN